VNSTGTCAAVLPEASRSFYDRVEHRADKPETANTPDSRGTFMGLEPVGLENAARPDASLTGRPTPK